MATVSTAQLLTATAHQLQQKLASGETTSVHIVEACLAQTNQHNKNGLGLNAIISSCPRELALAQAKKLDAERERGQIRSPLHGLPIVLKDVIVTGLELGMPTTAGAHVFASLKAKRNASLVDRLVDAGLIVIGKANLTEFCGLKSKDTPIGWSACGGQTLSPYRQNGLDESEQPIAGGSSSGSGVSVSAGISPLAIGTETAGSLVWPASLNGLYGIRLAPGTVPVDGVFRLSDSYDGIGAISRDPWTLAALVHILAPPQPGAALLPPTTLDEPTAWEGLTIGVTNPQWGLPAHTSKGKWGLDEVIKTYVDAVGKLSQRGLKVVYPLEAPDARILEYEGENVLSVAYHEFPQKVAEFISAFEHRADISSLEDIIKWNEEHAELALPAPHTTQTELIASLNNTMSDEKHAKAAAELCRLAGEDGMGKILDDHGLDIMISTSDAVLVEFAACARWPICTVPLGNLPKNNQPFGWFAMAREGREDVLLRFMSGFYQVFPGAQRATTPFSQL